MKIAQRRPASPERTIALAAAALAIASLIWLRNFPYPHDFRLAAGAMIRLLPRTGWAALKVWVFWGWLALVFAAAARRIEPGIGAFDAGLIGAAGAWVFAYLFGNLLGPFGLFRGVTLWLSLAVATVWLRRHMLEFGSIRGSSPGLKLALIATALAAFSLLPLQLTSPVIPYMDALSWPAAAQKVVTFARYLPFDNDPYGCWGPNVQSPALELFYAMLAVGGHCKLAALAESAAIVPMASLIIFGTYRLGAALFDDLTGGIAALLLFLTTIFRWSETMRGTAVDFALVACGLAFFIGAGGSSVLLAAGALVLGTAVASHAVDGALAFGVAAAAVAAWAIGRDWRRCWAGAISLAGAALIAAPEFAIATAKVVPVTLLIGALGCGAALVLAGAKTLAETMRPEPRYLQIAARVLLGGIVIAITYESFLVGGLHAEPRFNYPILSALAIAGAFALIVMPPAGKAGSTLVIIAAALMPTLIIEHFPGILTLIGRSGGGDFARFDLVRKLIDNWLPFVMIFPGAWLINKACGAVSRTVIITVLLAILILPLPHADFDYYTHEHSISENWMVDYSITSNGYWTPSGDSRWTLNPRQWGLIYVLRREVAAGRITPTTHILHIAHDVSPDGGMVRFSLFTGIDDDPVVLEPSESDWPIWLQGGRARPAKYLGESLARRPPYIVTELPWRTVGANPPQGYDLIFEEGDLKLYRRHDLNRVTRRVPQPVS